MTFLYLALYAMLILAATIAGDKSRLLANELRRILSLCILNVALS